MGVRHPIFCILVLQPIILVVPLVSRYVFQGNPASICYLNLSNGSPLCSLSALALSRGASMFNVQPRTSPVSGGKQNRGKKQAATTAQR